MIFIREITARKDVKKFIRFANDLYKDNPYYVPDMFSSQVDDFDKKKNPAYEYCDSKCFLAYKDGKIVGRIAAIYNTRANTKYNHSRMRFSHADYIDDDDVVDALFAAVEVWAQEKGCTSVHGPLGFSDMDREGLLIQGFHQPGQFFTNYNHPYYADQMGRLGYQKEIDWIEYRISLPDQPDERLERMALTAERKMKIHPANLNSRNSIRPYVEGVFKLYNEAYQPLYGMVALTPKQIKRYVRKFLPLVNERTTAIMLNESDEVVAFGVTAPSLSIAQQKCSGRLFPFGWYHLLKALNGRNDTLDLFLIAVRPDLQKTGVNAAIINRLLRFAIKDGRKYAETGPQLENNSNVFSQWRHFEKVQHKSRRCYVKEL